jgi:hypothetical protein
MAVDASLVTCSDRTCARAGVSTSGAYLARHNAMACQGGKELLNFTKTGPWFIGFASVHVFPEGVFLDMKLCLDYEWTDDFADIDSKPARDLAVAVQDHVSRGR